MAIGEPRCLSCGHVQGQPDAFPVTGLAEWSRGRREAELEERGQVAALQTEIDALRDALAATDADPFGPTAQWRGGTVCGSEECPCAAPNLPCREWAGIAETGAFCPCCGWNEAAHRISREAHRRRARRWRDARPVVATVRQQRSGPAAGLWIARYGTRTAAFSVAGSAVAFAHQMATEAAR